MLAFTDQMTFFARYFQGNGSLLTWRSGLLFLPSCLAAGLGYWQIERRTWKEDLLQRRLDKVFSSPISLFCNLSELSFYQRVEGRGIFDEQHSVYIGPRIRTVNGMPQHGYVLITPFTDLHSSKTVLVNRGWVPKTWKDKPSTDKTESNIHGLVVENEKPNVFVPKNEPHKGNWFFIDSTEIARHCGLSSETPVIQDLLPSKEQRNSSQIKTHGKTIELHTDEKYPVGKELADFVNFTIMPSDHTNYAIIWFSLSVATFIMSIRAIKRQHKLLSSKHSFTR